MSIQNAQQFIEHVRNNEDLRIEIEKIGQDLDALLALANREGYELNANDFATAIQTAGYKIETTLSDEDLATVSGGINDGWQTQDTHCDQSSCDCPSTDWPAC